MSEQVIPKERLKINGAVYEHVKDRLAGGKIFRAEDGGSYLRIGDPQLTAEEHIHQVSLKNRGYPVSDVLSHGKHNEQYYYVEESLGEKPFGIQFGEEFRSDGKISDQTFGRYLSIMRQYTSAVFNPANHRHAKTDIRQIALLPYTTYQYNLDQARMDRLFTRAQDRTNQLPIVEIHEDLGPFNVMDRGVIDFETVQNKDSTQNTSRFGPMGFDVVAGPVTGYYFPKVDGYFHKTLYEFSDEQLASIGDMVSDTAQECGVKDPREYTQEFLLMRTVWAAARNIGYETKKYDDPEQERFWSEFRANILHHVLDAYESEELIDPRNFPDIGAER